MKNLLAVLALLVFTAGPAHAGAGTQITRDTPFETGGGPEPENPSGAPATVPEPATLGLLAGGVLMLVAAGRSRQKKA